MPVFPCKWPTCTVYVRDRGGYCPQHAAQGRQQQNARHRFYDEHLRDPVAKAFYNSEAWRRVRREKLAADPVCERCRRVLAEHVHHRIAFKQCTETQKLDPANLMSLCPPCHNEKTAEENHVH